METGFSLIICGTCIDSLCEPADWQGFVRLFWCLSCFCYKLCIILFSSYIWSIYITVIWKCSLLLALTTILNVYFFLYIPRSSLLLGSEFFNAGEIASYLLIITPFKISSTSEGSISYRTYNKRLPFNYPFWLFLTLASLSCALLFWILVSKQSPSQKQLWLKIWLVKQAELELGIDLITFTFCRMMKFS